MPGRSSPSRTYLFSTSPVRAFAATSFHSSWSVGMISTRYASFDATQLGLAFTLAGTRLLVNTHVDRWMSSNQVLSAEEQQRLQIPPGRQHSHATYADLMVSGLVDCVDFAVNPRQCALQSRGASARGRPANAAELVTRADGETTT